MTNDIVLRRSRDDDQPALLAVWRSAVRATHTFLDPADFERIDRDMAEQYLVDRHFWVAVDEADRPIGFLALDESHIDMLFVAADGRGRGIGKALIDKAQALSHHARTGAPALTVDVNEQNDQAVGFYRHLGFRQTGRSPTDDAGRAYPLLHMRMEVQAAVTSDAGQM